MTIKPTPQDSGASTASSSFTVIPEQCFEDALESPIPGDDDDAAIMKKLSTETRAELIEEFCRRRVEIYADRDKQINMVKAGAKGRLKRERSEIWQVGIIAAQYGITRTWVFGVKAARFISPKELETRKMKEERIVAIKKGFEERREGLLQEYSDVGLDAAILRLVL